MTFTNVWSVNNSGLGFEVELSNYVGSEAPLTLTLVGLHALNNSDGGLFIRADAELRGVVSITDVVIDGTDRGAGLYLGNILTVAGPRQGGPDPNGQSGAALSLDNITIRSVGATSSPIFLERSWIAAHGCLMTPAASFVGHPERRQYCGGVGAFGGFSLTHVVVEDDLPRPFLNASMECSSTYIPTPSSCGTATLANITGNISVSNPRTCEYSLGRAPTAGWNVSIACAVTSKSPSKTDDSVGQAASSLATTLQILPPQGPMNQALLGVNWEGVVFGWSYRNQTCPKDCSIGSWVNQSDPLLSPKLVAALKALRVRSLRFPGGTPSNQYDWQNASFVPPSKCINKNEPCPPGGYWNAQQSTNQLLGKHRRQLSWQRFAVLLDTIGARGVWSLDIVQQTPAQAADVLSQLQKALPHHQPLSVELGNEIYGPPGQGNLFPTAQAYLSYVKPILAAQSGGSQLSVTVPPCPAVYTSNNCWGGNTTWLAGFYRNVSSACRRLLGDGHDQSPCPWQQVTAHHYRPRVSAIDCAPYNNCSYRRSLNSAEDTTAASEFGLVDELSQQGAAVTNLTFAAAMIAYPSVTLAAATNNWERDFPGLKLLISEYNADYASTWADHAKAPLGAGGEWMRAAADGGAHALHWAAGVLAGVNSNGIISGINYHSLQGAGETTKSPGFGILDWNSPGETVKANAVAQLMSHLSAITQQSSMHSVLPGDAMLHVAGIPAGLVIDNQGNLSAIQSAAFSSEDGSLTVVFINRGTRPVDVSIDIGRSGLYQNCVPPPAGLPAMLTSYSALDDGGWAEFDPATQTTPWPGPMSAARSQVTVAKVSPTVLGILVAPALSLVAAAISACPSTEP